jgi:ADP-ribose pyrophosphatase
MTDRGTTDGPAGGDLAWETLDSSTAYTCDGFDIVNQQVRLPDGTDAEFDYLSESEAVVILPFTPDGDVVVIDEWRQPVDRINRGLPAGSIEPEDDDPLAAAHRELVEETGYETCEVEHLTSAEPANGFSDSYFHYFVARDCEPTAEQRLDDNESIRVDTASFDDLVETVRAGDLRDGRSAFAVLYYALFEERTSQQ